MAVRIQLVVMMVLIMYMLPPVTSVVAGEQSVTLNYTYDSIAGESVNLWDDSHTTEYDRWDLSNFSFANDGVYHGSLVPESEVVMKPVQSHHQNARLKLVQNVTFPSSLIMSGSSKFWLRLPVKLCNTSCSDDADRIFNATGAKLYINNSETGQSFQVSGIQLYNFAYYAAWFQLRKSVDHDWNHGRPIIELNLPIYSNVEYEITFMGTMKTGYQTSIFYAFGDLGQDNFMGSYIEYQYYDTSTGTQTMVTNGTFVCDLGYTFIFQEGLSSTGITGVKFETPGSGQLFFTVDSNMVSSSYSNFTLTLPWSPYLQNETLNFTFEIIDSSGTFDYKRIYNVTWNGSYLNLHWNYSLFKYGLSSTPSNLSFAFTASANNVDSQESIMTVWDRRSQDRSYGATLLYDGNDVYYFDPLFQVIVSSINISDGAQGGVYRPTRAVRETRFLFGSNQGGLDIAPNFEKAFTATGSALYTLGSSVVESGLDGDYMDAVSSVVVDGVNLAASTAVNNQLVTSDEEIVDVPAFNLNVPSETSQAGFIASHSNSLLDSWLNVVENQGVGFRVNGVPRADQSGYVVDMFSLGLQMMPGASGLGSLTTLGSGLGYNLPSFPDFGEIADSIENFGARLEKNITKFLNLLVDVVDYFFTALLSVVMVTMVGIFVVIFWGLNIVTSLICQGDLVTLEERLFSVLGKGGGGGV